MGVRIPRDPPAVKPAIEKIAAYNPYATREIQSRGVAWLDLDDERAALARIRQNAPASDEQSSPRERDDSD